jgi:hypothetical protein
MIIVSLFKIVQDIVRDTIELRRNLARRYPAAFRQ